jgi:CubicO group peptidase (beta-lactamase class C family)
MRCFWTLVLWICFALPLAAQDAQTAARLVTAFETWIAENNAKTGTLSVRFKGEPVVQHGVGTDADTVMEMASLGKAVTGICVAEVVREGLLGYDDVFSDIVGKGPDLSVAQLLNQTS